MSQAKKELLEIAGAIAIVIMVMVLLANLSGCASLQPLTPGEALDRATESILVAETGVILLCTTDTLKDNDCDRLLKLIDIAKEIRGTIADTVEAIEQAENSSNTAEAILTYKKVHEQFCAVIEEINQLLSDRGR